MKSLRMYLLLLLLLGGIGAYADDVEFDVTSDGWNVSYSGTANVTLKGRIFTKGEWSGFCLPFDASKETLDAAFGEGCYSLQAYSSFADNKIQFRKVAEAVGGTPYFIYVNKTVENPKFDNVTFVSDIGLTWGGNQSDWRGAITINDNLTFRGFFFKKHNYELYNTTSDQTINAYYLTGDGKLQDVRKREYTDSPLGIDVCILINGYSSSFQKPTVVFEEDDVINSGGTSGGGSGESGGASGSTDDPTTLSYKIKNKLQLTDVPTLYIDIEGVGSTDTDLDKALFKNRQTGEAPYKTATVTLKDNGSDKDTKHLVEFTDKVDIKVRGNSTANPTNGKKAYRLKFPKKHKHDLLGLGYEKRNWALLANVFDHSMIRNALSYHLEKEVGLDFCPGYKFVDLVINGNYRGTYQICDHVETGTNRVDVDEDAGWMVEFQGRGDMLDQPLCFNQDGLQMNIKNPEPADETNAEEVATFIAPFQEWFTKTWSPQWKATDAYGANSGWRSVNDEESLMKFWIVTELTGDYDGWMTVKAYKEADEAKLHYGPVWDKDLAYGNYGGEQSAKLVSNNGNGSSLVTFLNESLLKDPIFTKKLKAKLDQLLSDGLYEKMCAKIDDLAAIVAQTEELSNTKFPRSSKVGEETNNYETYAETITPLKDYLKTRFETVQILLNELCEAANAKIEKVTYEPGNAWWNTGLAGYDFGNGNMNRLTDAQVDNRTYKANEWNSFCLPFDVSMDQMKTVFGNDVEVVNHVGMDTDAKTMLFAPVSETMLYAGEPYLVKFSGSDVVNPTFTDVIITQTANQATKYNGKGVSFDDKHTFYGTLFQGYNIKTSTDYLFSKDVYSSASSLAQATSNTENGARAFIRVSDGTTPAIKIQTADEASKFTYDVTNGYVHTAWCQYDNQTKNVTIENRGTLHADEWNMMCLPFKLSAAGYKKAFGEDVKVAEFTGVTKSEGGELVSFNLAYINEKNGMKAATPYLIKPSKDIPMADVTFEGVKVSAKTTEEQATGDVNCKLIGTLQPTILDKGHQQLVLKARNELQYMAPNSTTPMQACRAYFELTGTVAAAKSFSFSIDGETTGVKVIDVNAPSTSINTRVYNMNGQLVGTSMENLPQGIYVIAGKKVVK